MRSRFRLAPHSSGDLEAARQMATASPKNYNFRLPIRARRAYLEPRRAPYGKAIPLEPWPRGPQFTRSYFARAVDSQTRDS